MIAQLAALMANIHKKPGTRMFKPIDFMPFERGEQGSSMTAEQMKKSFALWAGISNKKGS